MAKIAVLDKHLINKIAAGEVVERPASVVKELLENCLDAGADRISVEIEDGGKKLIRITDNGGGMDAADLKLAFAPHATSKIAADDDLFDIRTLGFRGEALASIASISQIEAVSRCRDAIEACRLLITGGQADEITPCAAAEGTTIAVRNLFFNTPARRKFLRTTSTEMGHITEQFTRIALAHPAVQMSLAHNGRLLYDLTARQGLQERIAVLFSRELADGLLPIRRSDRGIDVSGLVARPSHARAGAQWQYVFLNRRYIRDRFLSHAIREAYRGMMEINRCPVVFLFLQMDPKSVDVNVHPTKIEVRFADSNTVHSQTLAAIRDKLLSSDLSVTIPNKSFAHTAPDSFGEPQPEPDQPDRPPAAAETHEQRQQRIRQAMADFFKSAPPTPPSRPAAPMPPASYNVPRPFTPPAAPEKPAAVFTPTPQPRFDLPDSETLTRPQNPTTPTTPAASAQPPRRSPRFLQVHNSYLVTENQDGIVIIDQHALHERVIYEKLHNQLQQGKLLSQRSLIPEIIDVTAEQMALIEHSRGLLEDLGILLEPFGPSSVAVQGFPVLLERLSPVAFIADLLDTLAAQSGPLSREEIYHDILDMMACKAAVKAGNPLDDAEIEALLSRLDTVDRSGNCPHGRPTTIRLSLAQLEKQFKRS